MTVRWAATSPTTGRFDASEQSGLDSLRDRYSRLQARGQGYVEVRGVADYPVVTLGFKDGVAAIQAFRDDSTVIVLRSGALLQTEVQIPVMDEPAVFSPEFTFPQDLAWSILHEFIHTQDLSHLGEWCEL